jgi:hypothetical protein
MPENSVHFTITDIGTSVLMFTHKEFSVFVGNWIESNVFSIVFFMLNILQRD